MKTMVLTICLLAASGAALADTTTVNTFVNLFHNWEGNHDSTFLFPHNTDGYSQVLMDYTIGCPGAPGDCDPWDRIGVLSVLRHTDSIPEPIEIARVITPYDITGNGGPGHCTWQLDVTPYLPLLHDSVTLRSNITTYIGGNSGWLVTVTFHFVEGQLDLRPYKVVNLWNIGYLVYGDPDNPPSAHLPLVSVQTDDYTQGALVRVVTSGHGQGNTINAAEFSHFTHTVHVQDLDFNQDLWRSDCSQNPCSPQGGTWQYGRAGWCPGSPVYPFDIEDFGFDSGGDISVQYQLADYENFCRPNNPNCITGQTCADCNYNGNGHTEPNYYTTGQLILYTTLSSSVPHASTPLPDKLELNQNYPNPFNPTTTIRFTLAKAGQTKLAVYDLTGREVTVLFNDPLSAGEHSIEFNAARFSSGIYFYSLHSAGQTATRKMMLMK